MIAEVGVISRNVHTVKAHVPLGLPTQRDIDFASSLAIITPADGRSETTSA